MVLQEVSNPGLGQPTGGSWWGTVELGNFEHAVKLAAELNMLINTVVDVYGFGIVALY